jgi:hypothetical protein
MIVVRNIFQMKFGQSGPAIELWKQAIELNKKLENGPTSARLLTDLAGGPFYTVVLEHTFDSLTHFENSVKLVLANAEWRAIYSKIVPMVESGRREILNVVG